MPFPKPAPSVNIDGLTGPKAYTPKGKQAAHLLHTTSEWADGDGATLVLMARKHADAIAARERQQKERSAQQSIAELNALSKPADPFATPVTSLNINALTGKFQESMKKIEEDRRKNPGKYAADLLPKKYSGPTMNVSPTAPVDHAAELDRIIRNEALRRKYLEGGATPERIQRQMEFEDTAFENNSQGDAVRIIREDQDRRMELETKMRELDAEAAARAAAQQAAEDTGFQVSEIGKFPDTPAVIPHPPLR